MSQEKIYDGATRGIHTAPLWGRLFLYALGYIPFTAIMLWIVIMSKPAFLTEEPDASMFLVLFHQIIFFGGTALPFILFEMTVRNFRKRWGLPMNKNVVEDLERLKAKGTVARSVQAHRDNGININSSSNKDDLGYWHDLLKKGAITEEEYDQKKQELL